MGHGGSVSFISTHPVAVVGDVVAGAAVAASWSGYLHEWLSVTVTAMAGIYYLIQFAHWVHQRFKK